MVSYRGRAVCQQASECPLANGLGASQVRRICRDDPRSCCLSTVPPFRFKVIKTYPVRGPLTQYRLEAPTSFECSRCGLTKTSKLVRIVEIRWDRLICNGCYGCLLSVWKIKAGELPEEKRADALLAAIDSAVTKVDIDQAKSRLLAADPQFDQLSVPAQRMLATAHAITHTLRAATGLDWSVAIIALCKAVEVEAGRCISQPLKDAVVGLDLRQDVNDRDFSRVARFCAGTSPPPELGSLIYFCALPRAQASAPTRAP